MLFIDLNFIPLAVLLDINSFSVFLLCYNKQINGDDNNVFINIFYVYSTLNNLEYSGLVLDSLCRLCPLFPTSSWIWTILISLSTLYVMYATSA